MSMPGSVTTGDLQAQTTVELNDSCNCCCWGRKVKAPKENKPATRALSAAEGAFRKQLEKPRDANEVYDLHMSVDIRSRRASDPAESENKSAKKKSDDKA